MNIKTIFFILSFLYISVEGSTLEGRGASFPKAVYHAWIKAYKDESNISIDYKPTGSGDGIISAVKRISTFSGTDKPLRPWRLRRYKLHMFPVVVGSIVLAYNIPGIEDKKLRLDEKTIAGIFSGKIKYWDDKHIRKNNMQLALPHKQIHVVLRSDGSGTTFNFTYYLRKIDYKDFRFASKLPDWHVSGLRAKGNSGMSQTIKNTSYSIGYTDYSSKLKYELTVATLKNRDGYWVSPNIQSAKQGAKSANLDIRKDFYGMIIYPKGKKSYPLIATTFILLPDNKSKKNKEVVQFFKWAFKNGSNIAESYGFSMLPLTTRNDINRYLNRLEL